MCGRCVDLRGLALPLFHLTQPVWHRDARYKQAPWLVATLQNVSPLAPAYQLHYASCTIAIALAGNRSFPATNALDETFHANRPAHFVA